MTASELLARLGIEGDLAHLDEALTHASWSNENRARAANGALESNQRLEFLGDAVLGLVVGELLMERFPDAREGDLSLLRSQLVNGEALASFARAIDLGAALRMGRGAEASGERDRENVLADAVEAIVAAVYLDRGLDAARGVAKRVVEDKLEELVSKGLPRDAKSALQETVQAEGGSSPRYHLVATEGPDHARAFVVSVEVDGRTLAEGRGRSKKLAEQAAARAALDARNPPVQTSRSQEASSKEEPQ